MSILRPSRRPRPSLRSRKVSLRLEDLEDRLVLSATQLVVTSQPPASVVAGASFGETVSAEDALGTVDTTFTGPVTVVLTSGGTLNGTKTVNAVAGVATFTGLTDDIVSTDHLTASTPTLTSATSTFFNVTPAAATHFVVTAQPPASVADNQTFGLTAAAEDQFGNVDTNFGGFVSLTLNGPGSLAGTTGLFPTAGVISVNDLQVRTTGTGDTVSLSTPSLPTAMTSTFNVTPTAANHLVVTAQPPATVVAGTSFGETVAAEDQFNNVDTNFTGAVTVTLNGNGTASGTTTINATAGVATFTGVVADTAGMGDTLTAASPTVQQGATSTPFNVTPAAASKLVVTAEPPATVVAGATFGLTVSAEDPFGNVDTTFNGPVTIALNGAGTLNGTLTVDAVAGVATFTGLSDNTAGMGNTLTATDAPLTAAMTTTFAVTPAAATKLVISTQPPASVVAGAPFGLVVDAEDQFGNIDTTFTRPVIASLNGPGTLGGTSTVNAVAGVATFSNLVDTTAGTGDTITLTSAPLTTVTTTAFAVTPAAATQLVITTEPPAGPTLIGSPFGLTVAAKDQFGNVDTNFVGPVTVALNGPGTLGGTTTIDATAGVATFTGLTVDMVGATDTLTVTSGRLTSATTTPFAIVAPLSISGTVVLDPSAAGGSPGGTPLPGRTVFIDIHGTGIIQPDDPQAVTDSSGNYTITGLLPGTYAVHVVTLPGDFVTNTPSVTLTNADATGQTIGLLQSSTILALHPTATPFAGAFTTVDAEIYGLYRIILGRAPDAPGLMLYEQQLSSQTMSLTNVAREFFSSPEYLTNTINSYYEAFLGRAGEPAGVAAWLSELQAGATQEVVAEKFLASPEFTADHPTTDDFTNALFDDVLGRDATTSELQQYDARYSAGLTRAAAANVIVRSDESYLRSIQGYYTTILARTGELDGGIDAWLNIAQTQPYYVSNPSNPALNHYVSIQLDIAQEFFGSAEYIARANASHSLQ